MIYSNEYARLFDNIARIFKKGTTWFYLLQPKSDWSFIYLSSNIEELGYTKEEFLTQRKKFKSLVYSSDWKRVREQINQALKINSREFSFEHRIVTAEKEIRTVENYFRLKQNNSAENCFIEGVLIDVTEYNKMTEKISILNKAVEQSSASVVITDVKGRIQYANKKCCEVTGYSYDELIGKNPRVLKGGYTTDNEYKNLWETISAGNDWTGEFHNRKKSGEYYWEKAVISPVKTNGSNISHFIAIKEDITMQKNIELQMEKMKQSYKSLFNNSKDIILISDLNGIILEMNPAAQKKLNLNGNGLLTFRELFLEPTSHDLFIEKLQKDGVVKDLFSKLKIKDDKTIFINLNSYPLFSEKNEIIFQTVIHELNDDFISLNAHNSQALPKDLKKI